MKCMSAQTRPRFILSSEGVFWGMEFEPMLTPREKCPLPENVPRGVSNPRHFDSEPKHYQLSYSGPLCPPFIRAVNRFKNPNRFFTGFLTSNRFFKPVFFSGSVITKRSLRSAKILAFYAMHVHIYVCVFKCISDQAAVN